MIFNQFDPTDIVAGRTARIASGFWPDSQTIASSSNFISGFFDLTQSAATPSPSFGSSIFDIRYTMFYINVFPDSTTYANNDPYFSISYGNFYGNLGSGSFDLDTGSIKVFPSKTIYTQYKNLLLGTSNVEDQFMFTSGSSANAIPNTPNDIYVINFSTYKMKDRVDEGVFQISFTGSNGLFTFIDDSQFLTQTFNVYDLVSGSIFNTPSTSPPYPGVGLLYPDDGILVLNATVLNQIVGLTNIQSAGATANYTSASTQGIIINGQNVPTTINPQALFWSIQNSGQPMVVRKSEYVPSDHYFIRIKNRDFNYSNNPTYVYDGSDNIHAQGTIRWPDFITDPRTYVTSIGLYNDNNELVAVAKLSRPALKSFDNELLIKVRLDF